MTRPSSSLSVLRMLTGRSLLIMPPPLPTPSGSVIEIEPDGSGEIVAGLGDRLDSGHPAGFIQFGLGMVRTRAVPTRSAVYTSDRSAGSASVCWRRTVGERRQQQSDIGPEQVRYVEEERTRWGRWRAGSTLRRCSGPTGITDHEPGWPRNHAAVGNSHTLRCVRAFSLIRSPSDGRGRGRSHPATVRFIARANAARAAAVTDLT